ncbi:MAG TPA: hypothetical protein VMV94_19940 [Phycisphaerae bacterium]|nr:hypothetical protein [Phycisphaerae bacterium]
MTNVDLKKLTPAERIVGDDAEDTRLLREMLQSATGYMRSLEWCPPIDRIYLGCGVGGVVAVFLFHFSKPIQGTDEWLWVVEGDLPTAYLVLDQASDPVTALDLYCGLMDEWARAVLAAQPLQDVFPVEAEPTPDNAENLLKRLDFIRTRLLPDWRANWLT